MLHLQSIAGQRKATCGRCKHKRVDREKGLVRMHAEHCASTAAPHFSEKIRLQPEKQRSHMRCMHTAPLHSQVLR